MKKITFEYNGCKITISVKENATEKEIELAKQEAIKRFNNF